MTPSRVAELRDERERAAREAARALGTVLEGLDRVTSLLEAAGEPALHHRAAGIRGAAARLQGEVAGAVGDLVRERVVEEIAAALPPGLRRGLSAA